MNPFPTRQAAETYLSRIPDLAVREATRARLGLDKNPESSAPRADMGTPVSAPVPVYAPSTAPNTELRTREKQQLAPDIHTFLGTLDGGALLFALPYPPSLNSIWRATVVPCKPKKPGAPPYTARVLLSADGRAYRRAVRERMQAYRTHAAFTTPPGARLALTLTACPPDRRARDLSNIPKALEDALTQAKVWADDSLIDELIVRRGEVCPGGRVVVQIVPVSSTLFEGQQP